MVPTSSTPVGTSYFSICSRRIEAISFGWSLNSLLRWSPGGHCVAKGAGPRGGRARKGRPCGRAHARSRRRGSRRRRSARGVTSWPLASASLARICSASASSIGTAVVSSSSSCRRARWSASCTPLTISAQRVEAPVVDEDEEHVADERVGALGHRGEDLLLGGVGERGIEERTAEVAVLVHGLADRREVAGDLTQAARRGRGLRQRGPVDASPGWLRHRATPPRAWRSRPRPAPLRRGGGPRPGRARGRRPSRSRSS